jgi:small subunit ribosomal protein S18
MVEEKNEVAEKEGEVKPEESKGRSEKGRSESGRYTANTRDSSRDSSEGPRQRKSYFRKKVCKLCLRKAKSVDYKDVDLLRKFVTDRGKILPRRITGTCSKHQRILSRAIKRARMAALLPFVSK